MQIVVMQIHGLGSEHLTREANEALIDEQMLEGRHLSYAGRRGPLPRNAVLHIVEISVRHPRVFNEPLTQRHGLLDLEQTTNHDETIATVGFP